jgi:hypothetical protein
MTPLHSQKIKTISPQKLTIKKKMTAAIPSADFSLVESKIDGHQLCVNRKLARKASSVKFEAFR